MGCSKPYQEHLREQLRSPREIVNYLRACIEDGDYQLLLLAAIDVIDALEHLPPGVTTMSNITTDDTIDLIVPQDVARRLLAFEGVNDADLQSLKDAAASALGAIHNPEPDKPADPEPGTSAEGG